MSQLITQIIYGCTIGAVYALIALGFSMVFRAVGLLNFAHQEFMMIGGLLGYSVLTRLGLPLPVTLLLITAACGAGAIVLDKVGLWPIRARRGPLINAIVATIGWGIIMSNGSMFIWGPYSLSYPTFSQLKPLHLGSIALAPQYLFIFGVGALVMVLLQLLLKKTMLGLAIRASAEKPSTAQLMGVPTNYVISVTFAISGAMAGLAGMLIASLYYASFDMGILGLKSLAAAVLGGFGSIPGAMLGGIALGVIENLGSTYISSTYSDIIAYLILILVLLIRPAGLLGSSGGSVA
ncbi:MAG: branched-chain amino acid ABC transporter permease [Candidatus Tectomicrobia bacterium]|nr:branched-chain amino acid ABC transporter permease [Candidatus Tectomicrobia bacterium]